MPSCGGTSRCKTPQDRQSKRTHTHNISIPCLLTRWKAGTLNCTHDTRPLHRPLRAQGQTTHPTCRKASCRGGALLTTQQLRNWPRPPGWYVWFSAPMAWWPAVVPTDYFVYLAMRTLRHCEQGVETAGMHAQTRQWASQKARTHAPVLQRCSAAVQTGCSLRCWSAAAGGHSRSAQCPHSVESNGTKHITTTDACACGSHRHAQASTET